MRHMYSDEEKRFLCENIETVKEFAELANMFNQKFGLEIKEKTLRCYCSRYLRLKTCDRETHMYSDEEKQFLRNTIKSVSSFPELTDKFNNKFGLNIECRKIRNFCNSSLHLKISKYEHHRYTEAEKQFLCENIETVSGFEELTDNFNRRFGLNMDYNTIVDYCHKSLKLKLGKNSGRFTAGTNIYHKKDIGEEISKDGYIWVKVQDNYHEGSSSYQEYCENWIPKHRYIYEQQYGEIPKDYIVIFLDSNKSNFSIDNLYCINRKIHAIMCNNRWFSTDATATKAAIKWCELYYAMHENYQF